MVTSAKSAYELINGLFPDMKVKSCREYDTLYVFELFNKDTRVNNIEDSKIPNVSTAGLISVNKKTGKIRDFKPFHISPAEYRSGRKIKAFW